MKDGKPPFPRNKEKNKKTRDTFHWKEKVINKIR
jgi:hypothetical protein